MVVRLRRGGAVFGLAGSAAGGAAALRVDLRTDLVGVVVLAARSPLDDDREGVLRVDRGVVCAHHNMAGRGPPA